MTPGASGLVAGAEIRTFLIADVRGYTRFTRERGDAEAARLAKLFADLGARRGGSSQRARDRAPG